MPGRGRPFEKGNKASTGRPRSNLTRLLGEFLEKTIPGDPNKRSYEEVLVERLVTEAIKTGDRDLFEFIWNRREGKVPDRIEGSEGAPVRISLRDFLNEKN